MVPGSLLRLLLPGRKELGGKSRAAAPIRIFCCQKHTAAHSPCPQEDFWMVSGSVLDKTGFVSVSGLCFQIPFPGFVPLCPTGSYANTREWHPKAHGYKNGPWWASLFNAGWTQDWFLLEQGVENCTERGPCEGDKRSLFKLHMPVYRWLRLFWLYHQRRSDFYHPSVLSEFDDLNHISACLSRMI